MRWALLLLGMLAAVLPSSAWAAPFPKDLLAVPPAAGEATLAARAGAPADAAVLRAFWADDGAAFASAARVRLAADFDRNLAALLAQYETSVGHAESAAELRTAIAASRAAEAARRPRASAAAEPSLSGKRPVVFLHGYNGGAGTWSDFVAAFKALGYGDDDLLVLQYYDDADNGRGLATGLTTFGDDTDTPIQRIAEQVKASVRLWLLRRAAMGAADEPPDWVCHSMGGLVFRCLYRDAPELAHRCVTLGTPHFGQNLSGSILSIPLGYQTEQMKYGSSFLWNLAADGAYGGHACREMMCVAGLAAENNAGVYWDGLVCGFSAALRSRADADYTNRTFFVNRVHAAALEPLYSLPGLLTLEGSYADSVFRLVYGYLTQSLGFAGGKVPDSQQLLLEDGMSEAGKNQSLASVLSRGGLFVQVLAAASSSANGLTPPLGCGSGQDPVLGLVHATTGRAYEPDEDFWERGHEGESSTNGNLFVYGDLPKGDYGVRMNGSLWGLAPWTSSVTLAGGGVSLLRVRPGNAPATSAFRLPNDTNGTFKVVLTNDWLVAQGLVASAEDLAGCVQAGLRRGANGYPAAVSKVLGLDPNDAASVVAFSGVSVADGMVRLGLRAGSAPQRPRKGSPLVVQSGDAPQGPWRDLPTPEDTGDGMWAFPALPGAFFRIVARP